MGPRRPSRRRKPEGPNGARAYIARMPLLIRFLGTAASRPTVERGVSSLAIIREGQTLLFDCGEGTQRQMMRYGVSFSFEDVFFTHMHSDHVLGITGLVRTLALGGRTELLRAWVPRGGAKTLRQCINLGGERTTFPIEITEVDAGTTIPRGDHRIEAFSVDHAGSNSLGWALVEEDRLGRFNPDLARELGIPEGPLWGKIHRGQPVTLDDGRVIEAATLVGGARRGRRIVLTGDTRPCQNTIEMSRDADVLIHEATFAEEEAARALETGHSTAREAAEVARDAGARRLVLTHISARYSRDTRDLESESKRVFANTSIARDGTEIELSLTEELAEATPP